MTPPINIDGTDITGGTIDGQTVGQITIDGQEVFSTFPGSDVLRPESNDLTHFGGDTGGFDINTNAPVLETRALKYAGKSSGTQFMASTTGLNSYPTIGKKHSYFINLNASQSNDIPRPPIHFNTQTATEGQRTGYVHFVDLENDNFNILRVDSGSPQVIAASSSVGLPSDSWLAIETLHESDGTITVDVFESSDPDNYRDASKLVDGLTVTDSTHLTSGSYDSTGIGFRQFNDTDPAVAVWRTE